MLETASPESSGPANRRNWRLVVDPLIVKGAKKSFIYDDSPAPDCALKRFDPRQRQMAPLQPMDLPVPKLKVDENSKLSREIGIINLNETVSADELKRACGNYGSVTKTRVLVHPATKSPLKLGRVVFESLKDAYGFYERFNNAPFLGKAVKLFRDYNGVKLHQIYKDVVEKSKKLVCEEKNVQPVVGGAKPVEEADPRIRSNSSTVSKPAAPVVEAMAPNVIQNYPSCLLAGPQTSGQAPGELCFQFAPFGAQAPAAMMNAVYPRVSRPPPPPAPPPPSASIAAPMTPPLGAPPTGWSLGLGPMPPWQQAPQFWHTAPPPTHIRPPLVPPPLPQSSGPMAMLPQPGISNLPSLAGRPSLPPPLPPPPTFLQMQRPNATSNLAKPYPIGYETTLTSLASVTCVSSVLGGNFRPTITTDVHSAVVTKLTSQILPLGHIGDLRRDGDGKTATRTHNGPHFPAALPQLDSCTTADSSKSAEQSTTLDSSQLERKRCHHKCCCPKWKARKLAQRSPTPQTLDQAAVASDSGKGEDQPLEAVGVPDLRVSPLSSDAELSSSSISISDGESGKSPSSSSTHKENRLRHVANEQEAGPKCSSPNDMQISPTSVGDAVSLISSDDDATTSGDDDGDGLPKASFAGHAATLLSPVKDHVQFDRRAVRSMSISPVDNASPLSIDSDQQAPEHSRSAGVGFDQLSPPSFDQQHGPAERVEQAPVVSEQSVARDEGETSKVHPKWSTEADVVNCVYVELCEELVSILRKEIWRLCIDHAFRKMAIVKEEDSGSTDVQSNPEKVRCTSEPPCSPMDMIKSEQPSAASPEPMSTHSEYSSSGKETEQPSDNEETESASTSEAEYQPTDEDKGSTLNSYTDNSEYTDSVYSEEENDYESVADSEVRSRPRMKFPKGRYYANRVSVDKNDASSERQEGSREVGNFHKNDAVFSSDAESDYEEEEESSTASSDAENEISTFSSTRDDQSPSTSTGNLYDDEEQPGKWSDGNVALFLRRRDEEDLAIAHSLNYFSVQVEDVTFLKMAYEALTGGLDERWEWQTARETRLLRFVTKREELCNRSTPHRSGSLRTEGFYRLPKRLKKKKKTEPSRVLQKSDLVEESAKATLAHELRAEARALHRLLYTNYGAETDSDWLKYDQMQCRSKLVRFDTSKIHGWGLFAFEDIAQDEMIIEYIGQKIRMAVAERREQVYEKRGIGSSYLFRMDNDWVVDATKHGNMARFINHSCAPNCYAKVVTVNGMKRIVIYSKQTINRGEEITYDYKFPREDEKIACNCMAVNCRGSLN